jgi:hypothetical protein
MLCVLEAARTRTWRSAIRKRLTDEPSIGQHWVECGVLPACNNVQIQDKLKRATRRAGVIRCKNEKMLSILDDLDDV